MTIEQELPLLLDELANSRAVGDPPRLADVVVAEHVVRSRSSARWPLVAAAVCIAVTIVGLIAVGRRGG